MNKLLVICGPTATGKTQLALQLAKKFNGELISADSRQVYRGMDIGTGKDLPADSKIWLYDVVNPNEEFSVADYYKLAWSVIKDVWGRRKLPILVGGTGFYIKAVTDGIETLGVPGNRKLRERLENRDVVYLQKRLKELNPLRLEKMNNSDRNNPRRLVRAIELLINKENKIINKVVKSDFLMIGLTAPKDVLYKRIDERVEKRAKQGIIEEIKGLLNKGYGWNLHSMSGLGYRQWKEYFAGKEIMDKTIEKWKNAEHQYAKRQLTWYQKDKRIIWYDILKKDFSKELFKRISIW